MSTVDEQTEVTIPNPRKVYVGNIPFSVTDADMLELFSKYGSVESAVVSAKGRRSLGFGFVVYETEEDALNAVSEFNKFEWDGRVLKVDIAVKKPFKPREPRPAREPRAEGEEPKKNKPKRRLRKQIDEEGTVQVDYKEAVGEEGENVENPKQRRFKRQPHFDLDEKSIFLGNLPFNVHFQELIQYFTEELGFQVDGAFVARRGRMSRGFGFVRFANVEEFDKCTRKYENEQLVMEGRTIRMRIANVNVGEEREPRE